MVVRLYCCLLPLENQQKLPWRESVSYYLSPSCAIFHMDVLIKFLQAITLLNLRKLFHVQRKQHLPSFFTNVLNVHLPVQTTQIKLPPSPQGMTIDNYNLYQHSVNQTRQVVLNASSYLTSTWREFALSIAQIRELTTLSLLNCPWVGFPRIFTNYPVNLNLNLVTRIIRHEKLQWRNNEVPVSHFGTKW